MCCVLAFSPSFILSFLRPVWIRQIIFSSVRQFTLSHNMISCPYHNSGQTNSLDKWEWKRERERESECHTRRWDQKTFLSSQRQKALYYYSISWNPTTCNIFHPANIFHDILPQLLTFSYIVYHLIVRQVFIVQ